MFKKWSYAVLVLLAGYLISLYPFALPIILGIICFCLFFIKYEELALLFVVLFLPFSFALNPTPEIDLSFNRILIISLFLAWLANSLARKKLDFVLNKETVLLVMFLLLAAGSVFAATEISWALRKILVFASIFPLYFVVSDLCGNRKNMQRIIFVMVSSAVLVSIIGIIQFFSQFVVGIEPVFSFWANYIAPNFYGANFGKLVVENPSWLVNIGGATYLRALSLFPDPHMFAFYLGLVLPIIFSLIISIFNKTGLKDGFFKHKNFFIISFFILLLTAALTYSRSGYIGIISGLIAVIVFSWQYLQRFSKFFILASLVSVFVMVFFTDNPVSSRLFSIADFTEGSNAGRIQIWCESLDVIDANLLTGVGIGNYSLEINPRADYRNSIYAHNTYLDIAAEMGIFAVIIWILLMVLPVFDLLKTKAKEKDAFKIAATIGLVGSMVSFSVSSLADTAIYSPVVLGLLMVILGMVSGIVEKSKD